MHFEGSVPIKADRSTVWAFVNDPTRVASCGPGVEGVQVIDDDHFKVTARVGIGMIRATFAVDITRAETREPDHASLTANGKAPGSAVDGSARMDLADGPDGTTVMDWSADVTIHGRLASVGARLIEGTARKLIDQTFDCMRAKMEA
ncbi:MAG: carbon monoxide dehydrogenase subunit G [Chloroflexi bacterium]|nr:carbon monoxide dehydrogenase subunit G [Chloroflexota bacterium]